MARKTSTLAFVSLLGALTACAPASDEGGGAACVSDDACKGDRICIDGMCIDPDEDEGEGESSGASGPADDPTPGPATSPGTSATTSPATGATGEPGSDETGPACSESDPPTCVDDAQIEGCIDGELMVFGCDEVCAQEGWESLGCDYSTELGQEACLCFDPPYGACDSSADCSADTPICVEYPNPMCSVSCSDDYDCPALPGQTVLCGGAPYDTYFCLVDCTATGECPDGTQCVEQWDGRSVCF